jgi:regulator of protease activity HflC (stomatin/prohibitin superfamily)
VLAAIVQAKPKLAEKYLEIVRTLDTEVAIIRFNGQISHVVPPGKTYGFWKDLYQITTEHLDVADAPQIERNLIKPLVKVAPGGQINSLSVPKGFEGFALVDGELRDRLKPGVYAYWGAVRQIVLELVDLRRQTMEVTAQEILTRDRVSVRVTLTAFWSVKDSEKASGAKDLSDQLYRHIQFAIRDATASRTLDELLNARGDLDEELTAKVRAMGAFGDLGVEVETVGVKDIILPGEMREILNRVVEAEKQAQANLIRRQEETAATRSLLNTARLMENNPLLLRMKEMETLEKITEKVGKLDVTTNAPGTGLDALLTNLVTLATPKVSDD